MITNTFFIDLSNFISESRKVILDTKTSVRSKRLSDFANRVMNEGLSYNAQVAFWQDELTKEQREEFPMDEFIKENKENIANKKKLNRAKTYRDAVYAKMSDVNQMKDNYDNLLVWLNGQLGSAIDEDLKTEIQNTIKTTEATIQTNINAGIDDLITRGQKDKSLDVLKEADEKVDTQLTKAISSGNMDLADYYRLHKTEIKQEKNGIKAENAINDFNIGKLRGDNAISLLDIINKSISNLSDDTVNIFIDGVKYGNMNAYLDTHRQNFINDTSAEGFVEKLWKENSDYIDTVKNKVGVIPDMTIDSIIGAFNKIKARPELAGIAQALDNKLYGDDGLLTKAINDNVEQIFSSYSTTYDFGKATQELSRLAGKYKVDTQMMINKLIVNRTDLQDALMNKLVSNAEQIFNDAVDNNENITWAEAIKRASEVFVGGVLSPIQLLNDTITNNAISLEKEGKIQLKTKQNILSGDVAPTANTSRAKYEQQGYKYLGSMADVNAQIAAGKKVELKEGSYYIVPDKTTAPPVATTPIGTPPVATPPPTTTPAPNKPTPTPPTVPAPAAPWTPPAGAVYVPSTSELSKFAGARANYIISETGGIKKYVRGDKLQYISTPSQLVGMRPEDVFTGEGGKKYRIL